jgi:hypothetical protein
MECSFHKQFTLLKAIDAADFVTAKYRADVKASPEVMPTAPAPLHPSYRAVGGNITEPCGPWGRVCSTDRVQASSGLGADIGPFRIELIPPPLFVPFSYLLTPWP